MTEAQRKERLMKLGAEPLADALLDLACRSKAVDQRVALLVTTPDEQVAFFRKLLGGLKRSKKFYFYRESREYMGRLHDLLSALARVPGKEAITELTKIYEADAKFAESVDDSGGGLRDFYFEVTQMFCVKAKEEDVTQAALMKVTKKLMTNDGYGLREEFMEKVGEFLDKKSLQKMLKYCEEQDPDTVSNYAVECLIRAQGDPRLYYDYLTQGKDVVSDYTLQKVAEMYLETGDAQSALEYMQKCTGDDDYYRGKLRMKIYVALGMKEEQEKLIVKRFTGSPSMKLLGELIECSGDERADEVVEEHLSTTMDAIPLKLSALAFMLELGRISDASTYLLARAELIDGRYYSELPKIAKSFVSIGYLLEASLIYRALVHYTLGTGISKNYRIAVSNLKKLHTFQPDITDWHGKPSHADFLTELHKDHFRKSSFWSKVPAEWIEGVLKE